MLSCIIDSIKHTYILQKQDNIAECPVNKEKNQIGVVNGRSRLETHLHLFQSNFVAILISEMTLS